MRTEQTQRSFPISAIILMIAFAAAIGVGVPTLTYNSHSDTVVYLVLSSVIVTAIFASLFFVGDSA